MRMMPTMMRQLSDPRPYPRQGSANLPALPCLVLKGQMVAARVPNLGDMPSHEHIIKHMENRHPDALKLKFTVEPGRSERRIYNVDAWIAFHDRLHALDAQGQYDDHYHK